ncbi:MAG: heterodisulfide reductase-related iron-sulfur binding cluster [Acidobacteriota bacterium]|nr:heterodisulfide reductase-related iron-sulfur binding cluster [Blastocatellia bacterium]MDW8412140.1 heterodisulfide reductase-related iron-sulfur binding cluster [Acidobacteriota bacterium]
MGISQKQEKLLACIHCGLCLQACPTYRLLGDEADSPRGRLYMMRAVAEGRMSITDSYIKHIDLCLGCRACETACPSGVEYGHLLEAARAEFRPDRRKLYQRLLESVLSRVFPRRLLLGVSLAIARVVRPFFELVFAGELGYGPALLYLSAKSDLRRVEQMLLEMGYRERRLEQTAFRGVVAFFSGCIMDGLYSETNAATLRVLEAVGYQVYRPKGQGCCGALQAHTGRPELAKRMARRNLDAFVGFPSVVVNAAGCGAMMKGYGELFGGDACQKQAEDFSLRVRDFSELLGSEWLGERLDLVVAYSAPCHLHHGQRIRSEPVQLVAKAAQIVELKDYERCCGSAGIYNVMHPEVARDLINEKVENIMKSGAQVVVTANPGCAMQLAAGLAIAGRDIPVLHLAELLDLSLRYSRGKTRLKVATS